MIEKIQAPPKRIFGLDLLRVISIMLVFCSHTSYIYPADSGIFFKIIDMCGFFGVELFFVMSGFLIGRIMLAMYLRDDYSFKTTIRFLYRRLMRIIPNYYLIILVNTGIWVLLGYSVSHAWKYFFFAQNFAAPLLPFFPESWSLPIKEFGYVIAVLVLYIASLFLKKPSRKSIFLIVITAMVVFFFFSKIYYNYHTANTTMLQWDISLRSVVIYRIDTVLVGVLFGYLAVEFPNFWQIQRYKFAAIGVLFLLLLLFCLGYLRLKIEDAPFFWNVLCLPLSTLGLVCFLPFFSEWKSAPARWSRPIAHVSELSYAIYLLHYSIVLFLMKHFIDTTAFSLWQLHLFSLIYLVITYVFSYLMYNYFEKPTMKLRDIKF